MKIVLTSNPNRKKTKLFNEITGKIAGVGNCAGVIVEKRKVG